MKIAMAQINPTVGDIAGNSKKIKHYIRQASAQGADLVVFSELSLIGYPPRDLLLKGQFIEDNIAAAGEIARHCDDCAALIGFVSCHKGRPTGKPLHNSVALLHKGRIKRDFFDLSYLAKAQKLEASQYLIRGR